MLNAVGHLFLGKVLSLFTYGSIAGFPVSSQEVQTLPGTSEAKVALRESISSPALLNNFQQEIRRQLNGLLFGHKLCSSTNFCKPGAVMKLSESLKSIS